MTVRELIERLRAYDEELEVEFDYTKGKKLPIWDVALHTYHEGPHRTVVRIK